MIKVDFEKALLFIDEHGNIQDKARLLYLLASETPPDHITRPLLDKQNPDGGFPSRPRGQNPSSVDSTLTALWQLNEVGMLGTRESQNAQTFLVNTQLQEGGWDENPDLPQHDLPPWIVPGQLATRLYLSAYSAYWLGLASFALSGAFDKAVHFLSDQQMASGEIPGYYHSQWIATGAFLLSGPRHLKQAESSLNFLAARPPAEWEDSQIAWALDCLGSAGLLASHPLVQSLLDELMTRQEPSGSWASEDGPAYAVSATISALKALKIYGLLGDF